MALTRPKIAKAKGRSVKEWIGRTPESMPPPSVRLRIFDRSNGTCCRCKQKIQVGEKWQAHHLKRVEDGGPNIESNFRPIHIKCHRVETAEETTRGKKADRSRKAHLGIKDEPMRKIAQHAKPEREHTAPHMGLPPLRRRNPFTGEVY